MNKGIVFAIIVGVFGMGCCAGHSDNDKMPSQEMVLQAKKQQLKKWMKVVVGAATVSLIAYHLMKYKKMDALVRGVKAIGKDIRSSFSSLSSETVREPWLEAFGRIFLKLLLYNVSGYVPGSYKV